MPPNYHERDLLKFLQAYNYKMKKILNAIEAHFKWRVQSLPCRLTTNTIKAIVSTKFMNSYRTQDFYMYMGETSILDLLLF